DSARHPRARGVPDAGACACVGRGLAAGAWWVAKRKLPKEEAAVGTAVRRRPHAEGGTRTRMGLRPLDFESSASTNSATPAARRRGCAEPHNITLFGPFFQGSRRVRTL